MSESRSVNQSVKQIVSQSVSQSVWQSVSQSVSLWVSEHVSQWVSQSLTATDTHWHSHTDQILLYSFLPVVYIGSWGSLIVQDDNLTGVVTTQMSPLVVDNLTAQTTVMLTMHIVQDVSPTGKMMTQLSPMAVDNLIAQSTVTWIDIVQDVSPTGEMMTQLSPMAVDNLTAQTTVMWTIHIVQDVSPTGEMMSQLPPMAVDNTAAQTTVTLLFTMNVVQDNNLSILTRAMITQLLTTSWEHTWTKLCVSLSVSTNTSNSNIIQFFYKHSSGWQSYWGKGHAHSCSPFKGCWLLLWWPGSTQHI